MKVKSFSNIFALLFSIIGIIIGIYIAYKTTNKDYQYFYVYSGLSGFITTKLFAKYIIEKGERFNHIAFIIVAVLTGLVSHWLCWYMVTLKLYFEYWIIGEHFYSKPIDSFLGLFGVIIFLPSKLDFHWMGNSPRRDFKHLFDYLNL